MPQLQTLVLKDRTSPTPVDHTFVPRDIIQPGSIGVVVASSGTPIGDKRLQVSCRKLPSGKFKAELRLIVPVVQDETVNGITNPKVVRTGYADVTFTFDGKSLPQERKDIVGFLESALGASKTLVNETIVDLHGVY